MINSKKNKSLKNGALLSMALFYLVFFSCKTSHVNDHSETILKIYKQIEEDKTSEGVAIIDTNITKMLEDKEMFGFPGRPSIIEGWYKNGKINKLSVRFWKEGFDYKEVHYYFKNDSLILYIESNVLNSQMGYCGICAIKKLYLIDQEKVFMTTNEMEESCKCYGAIINPKSNNEKKTESPNFIKLISNRKDKAIKLLNEKIKNNKLHEKK